VKALTKGGLLATVVCAGASLGGPAAFAQFTPANTGVWGTEIPARQIDPAIRAAADALGMVRDSRLVIGQLNLLEYVGSGTMTDPEQGKAGQSFEVSRFSYAVSYHFEASRLDFEGPNTPRTVRVVKKARAWNEEKPGINPTPSDQAFLRAREIWLTPHGAIHAAAFASAKKCLDGKPCDIPLNVSKFDGKIVITTKVNGDWYTTTLGADRRPERVETMVKMPDGSTKTIVATYSGYRNGTSVGQEALDKFHSGTFWPSRIVQEIDGTKVLDITMHEGWSNPYVIFPEPELLAKGK